MIVASVFTEFWNDQLVSNSRQGLFLVLLGFVGSFLFIRMSARLMRSPRVPWWPGSVVSDGGLHIHHLVFGNVIMLVAGALGFWFFDTHPWMEVCAAFFGIGAGLTFDEFAMLVHLEDVYWSREGRASVDAAVIAVAAMGLVFLGVRPFDFETGSAEDVVLSIVFVFVTLVPVTLCFVKQRIFHGAVGFFIFPLAIYGASRVGKPGSVWAKRRYGEHNPAKQAKAEQRFGADRRTERYKERFRDAVGGSTGDVFAAKVAERERERELAAAELRRRADQLAAADRGETPAGP